MDSRQEDGIEGHISNKTVSAEYQSGSKAEGLLAHHHHHHHYQFQESSGHSDRRPLSEASDNSLPSSHLSAATTGSIATNLEPVSSRPASEVDQQRQNPPQLQKISSPSVSTQIIPPVQLKSIAPNQPNSWSQSSSELVSTQFHTPSHKADIPENEPSYEHVTGDVRYNAASFPAAIKLLVSNNVAGSIIGRSGQTISDLQTQSATRIKLSQAGDYYPGTQDRVCLVQGRSENVKKAVNLLLTRLFALQQQQHYHHFAWQRQQQERSLVHSEYLVGITAEGAHQTMIPGFSFVVRILVPVPCCGMIIGKGGSNIKQLVDDSGVSSVRLSPKEVGGSDSSFSTGSTLVNVAALVSATAERIVTITGPDLNSCLTCTHIILEGMTSHPDISRYANMTTSYTRLVSAAAQNTFPGTQVPTGSICSADTQIDSFLGHPQSQEDFVSTVTTIERSPSHGYLDRQPAALPGAIGMCHPSPSQGRIIEPMAPFIPFGAHAAPYLQDTTVRSVQSMQSSLYLMHSNTTFSSAPSTDETLGLTLSHSAPDLLALQMQSSLRLSELVEGSATTYPVHSSFAPQIPQQTHTPPGFVVQLAIADNLIGSILGRGGRTLNELQVLSNTRIRISQRGEYVPGTKNRIVMIRGPTAQSVTNAQFLMSQRMILPPTASTYMDRPPDYGTNTNIDTYNATAEGADYSTAETENQIPQS
mmetsp:Transcript_7735/g.8837  ORF Transcript_7735/g.8837 Transcript_7735/m.8837 type:complete len:701 (-) Transcript_7735:54-2156(-)|eukprot:CAMPEP_0194146708 /NCGR_PEP_ID=MMETSP0152-20130528/21442_1 /TAXON_ID=1049557 /ORGANISM="Thalassiothrix antarctica, Strain L6-D1" /LENGTH=700 /DNA_ID=CAMNT_0038847291 /DNA_START=180 /DNA_END=2282 /DNA_ORIENTATION=+